MPQKNCVLCNKKLKLHQRRPVNKIISKYLRKFYLLETSSSDFICGGCSKNAYPVSSAKPKPSIPAASTNSDGNQTSATCKSPPSIHLPIRSASKSHSYCFICKKPGPKIIVVPACVRYAVFIEHGIVITAESRCCPSHFNNSLSEFNKEELVNMKTKEQSFFNRSTLTELINKTRELAIKSSNQRLSFDNIHLFSDEDLINLTGLNKEQFLNLYQQVESSIKNTPARTSFTTLGLFLFKLKCGLSNKILSTMFNITKSSIRRGLHSVRQALLVNIVPSHLGFQHITREEVIKNHTRQLAQDLLAESPDQVILVLDGTYIYINKSDNFQFQRRSYSMHKNRPLVKPMVIVSSSGYFVSVLGPYFADSKNNDASILKHILNNNIEQIKSWIDPSDVFVIDRGFRDAITLLKEIGIQAEMPRLLAKKEKQMSTDDANASRLVTKVRWVVEAANARIKRWKYLAHVLPTNQVPYIGDYIRIVCALSNMYLPPINKTQEHDLLLGLQMKDRLSGNLSLQDFVEENNLGSRSVASWTTTDSLTDFPKLSETMLRVLTLGTYQLKLSSSYVQEYMGGECDFQFHKEIPGLLRVRLQSRHISSKSYLVWIRYDEDHVIAWYCKCRAGARTVGTCSHVAAVIWYLGMAVNTGETNFGVKDWGEFLEDASANPETIDSSDSDESVIEE